MIDLRSDTVTRPSEGMRKAMYHADVGDDVFGDDPTVKTLEEYGAALFGKSSAVFCASGTMANQIALNIHTSPGDEVICSKEAHIYKYEGGGMARTSGLSPKFIDEKQGIIDAGKLTADVINPDDVHFPRTTVLSIEDTCNRGGGVYYDFKDIQKLSSFCKTHDLAFHLDGARVFNALCETEVPTTEYGQEFTSLSICLSKGLGAPVGSLLLGDYDFISEARRVRKVMGGGMRQVGILAAAGMYALENNVDRLKQDHKHAKQIGRLLADCDWVDFVVDVKTNIVVAHVNEQYEVPQILDGLKSAGILAVPFGKGRIRMVSHLNIDDGKMAAIKTALQTVALF